MTRCGLPKLHRPHGECDGGSNYVDSFEDNEIDYERGVYFESYEDDCVPMSATERDWHPENA
jgi:hypothetical protein